MHRYTSKESSSRGGSESTCCRHNTYRCSDENGYHGYHHVRRAGQVEGTGGGTEGSQATRRAGQVESTGGGMCGSRATRRAGQAEGTGGGTEGSQATRRADQVESTGGGTWGGQAGRAQPQHLQGVPHLLHVALIQQQPILQSKDSR